MANAEVKTNSIAAGIVRVGFVPLLDAAPLIAADRLGYFQAAGLNVILERQIGWGNVRDKLVYGQLDASHALLGMPPSSVLGRDSFSEPLTAIMELGRGGNVIVLSRRLINAGVTSASHLAARLGARLGARSERSPHRETDRPMLGHVFGCSTHHYLLREWLVAGGVDPDRDVQLAVMPPGQMARQMEQGCLDGFCVGEPWGTVAQDAGLGSIVATTTDAAEAHPEKVLSVTRRWLSSHADTAVSLVRALLKACAFCNGVDGRAALPALLARPEYLNVPANLLAKSLTVRGGPDRSDGSRRPLWSCAPGDTFPSATHMAWLLGEMMRWGHLPQHVDVRATAQAAVDTAAYRRAADAAGAPCPPDDFPPMRMRGGWSHAGPQPEKKNPTPQLQGACTE